MEIPQVTVPFQLKITNIFGDGFQGVDLDSTGLFRKTSMVKDKFALKDNNFKEKDIVEVKITTINEEDIREDKQGKEFYCVVYELTNYGFYTKHYKEYESKFKREFFYNARGMITFTKEEYQRFDVGDILKVAVKRL